MQKTYKSLALDFTNNAINSVNHKELDFKNSNFVTIPFKFSKDDIHYGIKLRVMKSGEKYFYLHGRFDGRDFSPVNLGNSNKAKCKDITKLITTAVYSKTCIGNAEDGTDIEVENKDENNRWNINPNTYFKKKYKKVTKRFKQVMHIPTIKQCIIEAYKDHLPRVYREGTLNLSTMRDITRDLIGYNKRTLFLKFSDDNGKGRMSFRERPNLVNENVGFIKKVKPITNWDQFFKKYPPGDAKHFWKIDPKLRPNYSEARSLIDDKLSEHLVTDLSYGLMRKFLQRYNSFGRKRSAKRSLSWLHNYAKEKGYLGDNPGINPAKLIVIKRPEVSACRSSQYNDFVFTLEECRKIEEACMQLREYFPIAAELILFLMKTGRRFKEVSRLRLDYIKDNKIIMPSSITKTNTDSFITKTKVVQQIINLIQQQKYRMGMERMQEVPWLFPSIMVTKNNNDAPDYLDSYETRIKTITRAWYAIKEEAGIAKGTPKAFRKTYATQAEAKLGNKKAAMALTGHEDEDVFDSNYSKQYENEVIHNADQVSDLFDFTGKTLN
ncbi:MAG: tyrosine-type recombinase/integrase [Pelagibacteraceae bacterium]|nr:tyrosine-type recombinase/integrase [Pelagibacteraceae bacterium]